MKIIGRAKRVIARYIQRLKAKLANDKNIYIIYSMGKVGSSTVFESLKSKKPFSDIFHVHFLSSNSLENLIPQLPEEFHHNIEIGRKILSFIKQRPNARIKIITLTREPIMRAISDLFENWKHLYNDIEQVPKSDLKTHIESQQHDYVLEWFDTEFKEYLDFDIYANSFDKERGYGIYRHKNCDILCIKLERLSEVASSAFKDFLGEDISLSTSNSSEFKGGKDSYAFLKANVSISEDRLVKLYNSKYMRHFYTEEEIHQFTCRWSGSASKQ